MSEHDVIVVGLGAMGSAAAYHDPQLPNVVYAAGFSGHGFKFASVIGEVLADLATTGQARPDAHFLRAERLTVPKSADGASR